MMQNFRVALCILSVPPFVLILVPRSPAGFGGLIEATSNSARTAADSRWEQGQARERKKRCKQAAYRIPAKLDSAVQGQRSRESIILPSGQAGTHHVQLGPGLRRIRPLLFQIRVSAPRGTSAFTSATMSAMERGMLYDNLARMAAWTPMVLVILAIGSAIALWLARKKLRLAPNRRVLIVRAASKQILGLSIVSLAIAYVPMAPLFRSAEKLSTKEGKEFPDVEFKLVSDGSSHRLHDYQGKVVVINFWATGAGPAAKSSRRLTGCNRATGTAAWWS